VFFEPAIQDAPDLLDGPGRVIAGDMGLQIPLQELSVVRKRVRAILLGLGRDLGRLLLLATD